MSQGTLLCCYDDALLCYYDGALLRYRARRAAKEAKEAPAQPAPEKPRVDIKKFVKIGRPGYKGKQEAVRRRCWCDVLQILRT